MEQHLLRPAAIASAISAALALAQQAHSQEVPSSNEPVQQVVITGSRIARTSDDAPSPVTTLGSDELTKIQATNIGAALSSLPAFRASSNPTTNGFGSFNVGAQIVNLRGLGVTRTLILLDGRRFAPTTREGSADLNLIPSLLIDRTEMVTGGASAAYGSDAIAGVVNINLRKDITGLEVQADYGKTDEHDGENYHLSLATGTHLLDDRAKVVFGAEVDHQQGIGNCFVRDWCTPAQVVTNPGFNTPAGVGNGQPNFVRSDTNAGFWMTQGGVVTSGLPADVRTALGSPGGIQFDANGNVAPYTPGSVVSGVTQLGGTILPTYLNTNLTVPVERYTMYTHGDMALTDNITGFVDASFGHVTGSVLQSSFFDTAISINIRNPFIPSALAKAIADHNAPLAADSPQRITTFTMGRVGDDLARGFSTSTANVKGATAGLNGRLGESSTWSTYYQFSRTDRLQTVAGNRIQGDPAKTATDPTNPLRFARAVDAIRDTETVITPGVGDIVCAATLDPNPALRAAAAGCVPLNLFGANRFSPTARNYVYGTLVEDIDLTEHLVGANLQGEVAQLWAGPLSLAGGLELRRDHIDVVHDPLSNQYAYFQNFGSDYNGTSKVAEVYAEGELPLLKDAPAARRLELNAAARYARYNQDGFGSYLRTSSSNDINATTWKGSLVWEPVDWLRVRGTRSRDIRAPNFADLYLASASSFAPVLNRFDGKTEFPSTLSGGTPNLDAEKADTTTAGFVFSPKWGWTDRARLSIDYYDIKVKGYIASPGGGQFIMDRCFAGNTQACGLLTFGAGNVLTGVRNISLNLDELRTRGEDFELSYALPIASDTLDFRLLASHVEEITTTTFGIAVDRAGQTGGIAATALPDWLLRANLSWTHGPASLTLQARYIDKGVLDATRIDPTDAGYAPTLINSTNDNHVASATYVNLFGSYDFGVTGDTSVQLFGSISNLFNKEPPFAPELQYPTNPTYFDQIGRSYRAGLRIKF